MADQTSRVALQQTGNRLLAALSEESRRLIENVSVSVNLAQGRVLMDPHGSHSYCYFLTSGIASAIACTPSGESAEVGIIGHEGMVGGLHLLGPARVFAQSLVQIDIQALRLPIPQLKRLFQCCEEVRTRVLDFVQAEALTTIQIAGCHRFHGTEERMARWILMVHDRVQADVLKLTHSFLALMLGVTRPTATLVARSLQERGIIELYRGGLRVLNRRRLEAITCHCYWATRDLYDGLYRDDGIGAPRAGPDQQ